MEHRQLLIDKIVQTASKDFFEKGVKAVKMDDIAKSLGISKRTLYEIFDNKEQLLIECLKQMAEQTKKHMDRFVKDNNPSVIAVTVEFYRLQMQKLNGMSPDFLIEIRKYPSVVKWMEKIRLSREKEGIEFFEEGVKEGYFRKDVNYKLIVQVCDGAMENVFHNKLFNQYSLKQIFTDVMMLYIRGFCTLKGIEALEQLL